MSSNASSTGGGGGGGGGLVRELSPIEREERKEAAEKQEYPGTIRVEIKKNVTIGLPNGATILATVEEMPDGRRSIVRILEPMGDSYVLKNPCRFCLVGELAYLKYAKLHRHHDCNLHCKICEERPVDPGLMGCEHVHDGPNGSTRMFRGPSDREGSWYEQGFHILNCDDKELVSFIVDAYEWMLTMIEPETRRWNCVTGAEITD